MTLDEAVEAVESTFLPGAGLRVDRARARVDDTKYLLIVLDPDGARGAADGAGENGPRLVDRGTGLVERLTVPDAVAMSAAMRPAAR